MFPTFWLRCKSRLVRFKRTFLSHDDYNFHRSIAPPVSESRPYEYRWSWLEKEYEPSRPKYPIWKRADVRAILLNDAGLRRLLGRGRYLIEVVVREGQLRAAVYPVFDDRREYSTDDVLARVDLVRSFRKRAEKRGEFRFVHYANGKARGVDVVSIDNNPLFPHQKPLFIYNPLETH